MSQDVLNLLAGLFFTGVGWVLKTIWDAIKRLQDDMKEFERDVRTNFVSKIDYKEDLQDIKAMLKQIFDKLDKKVDRA